MQTSYHTCFCCNQLFLEHTSFFQTCLICKQCVKPCYNRPTYAQVNYEQGDNKFFDYRFANMLERVGE